MITEFGKELRKIRIDHDEILKDMAEHLGVTASFLSAVEVGKKNIPNGWIDLIAQAYNLNKTEKDSLEEKAQRSINAIKINLYGSTQKQRDLALVFARKFDDLSDETASKILNFMAKNSKEG